MSLWVAPPGASPGDQVQKDPYCYSKTTTVKMRKQTIKLPTLTKLSQSLVSSLENYWMRERSELLNVRLQPKSAFDFYEIVHTMFFGAKSQSSFLMGMAAFTD